jgi:hypothetical protein
MSREAMASDAIAYNDTPLQNLTEERIDF